MSDSPLRRRAAIACASMRQCDHAWSGTSPLLVFVRTGDEISAGAGCRSRTDSKSLLAQTGHPLAH